MNKKLCALYVVIFSLTMLACSNDSVSGSSEDPNVLTAEKSSSSSTQQPSSSSVSLVLCKASGDWGSYGCHITLPSGEGDLWSTGDLKVKTSAYVKDSSKFGNRAGELFFETDSVDGENTKVHWIEDLEVVPEFNGQLEVQLSWGARFDPFFNIGFYVAGFDSNGVALSADVSNWNGICVMYRGTTAPVLQLDLGDSLNKKIGYVLPSIALSTTGDPQCYEWKLFKQHNLDNGYEFISGEEAAKHVEKVIFHFQPTNLSNNYEFIHVLAIGTNRD